MGVQVQASALTAFLPSSLYDVRTVDGIRFGVRLSRPEDYMVIYMSHEKAFHELKPARGDVVLDMGAHIGSYSLRYSRLVGQEGRVISFEPDPENRRILSWNLRLNNAQNVQVRREALGDFTGEGKLRISSFPGQHSFVHSSKGIRQVSEIVVPVAKLDDIRLDKVDFVKMDVEGYELNVLRGGEKTILSLRPRMQIEVHGLHGPECQVCLWLEARGLSRTIIDRAPGSHWIEAR